MTVAAVWSLDGDLISLTCGVSAAAVVPGGHTLLVAGVRGDTAYLKAVQL
ncbi:hypothetical protein ACGFZP_36140 [Kitasatospora sp. NPDC048239]